MKKILILLPLVYFFAPFSSGSQEVKVITEKKLVELISGQNYRVYETALRVYQARMNVEKARADLLTKLNIWSIAKLVLSPITPLSLLESMPEVAPFLVPANWFRLEENKLLHLSEKEGYRSLWANELQSAKILFRQVLFDRELLKFIEINIQELQQILIALKTREDLGVATPGAARDMEIRILGLKEDARNLYVLVEEEQNSLSYALGLENSIVMHLVSPEIPVIDTLPSMEYSKFEFAVLANSPERRQNSHFLSVIKQIKKEVHYSFLGGSSVSRGVAGGVFDNLPTPNGLGFGQGPALKIVEAQAEILRTQRKGIEETLKRQLKNLMYSYNLDLQSHGDAIRRIELTEESKNQFLQRMELGEDVNLFELAEVSRNLVQARASMFALQFRVMNSLDRLDRLAFVNDYKLLPPVIEELKER